MGNSTSSSYANDGDINLQDMSYVPTPSVIDNESGGDDDDDASCGTLISEVFCCCLECCLSF